MLEYIRIQEVDQQLYLFYLQQKEYFFHMLILVYDMYLFLNLYTFSFPFNNPDL